MLVFGPQAKDKGTRVINEDGLFALINATSTMRAAPAQPAEPSVPLPPVVRASAPAAMAAKPLTVAGSSLSKPGAVRLNALEAVHPKFKAVLAQGKDCADMVQLRCRQEPEHHPNFQIWLPMDTFLGRLHV